MSSKVPSPKEGKGIIKINSVIHPNDIYSIVGEGLKDLNDTAGDIKIEFNVVFPSHIDKERKVYIQKLLKKYNENN